MIFSILEAAQRGRPNRRVVWWLIDAVLMGSALTDGELFRHCERSEAIHCDIDDEAIQTIFAIGFVDCFAEPVIGRAFARPVGLQ
jgi:hypothetical protein